MPPPATRVTCESSSFAPPVVVKSQPAAIQARIAITTRPRNTRSSQRRRARVWGGGGDSRIGASALISEGHRHGEREAKLARILRVREVDRKRPRWRLEARAHAVAR